MSAQILFPNLTSHCYKNFILLEAKTDKIRKTFEKKKHS